MRDNEIDSIVKAVAERIEEKTRIENIADMVLDRLWQRFLQTVIRGMAGYYEVPKIPPKEGALCKWKESLPEGAEFDKDVDLNLIVDMYPLTTNEIEGAIVRAYKLSIGQTPGKPVQRKQAKAEARAYKIKISDISLRMGIVWALGDRVLLKRIDRINEGIEENVCRLEHWCKEHSKDDVACRESGSFSGDVSSFCKPIEGVTGFKCPTKVGFDCDLTFQCYGGEKFVFDCDGGGKKKFICSTNIFNCMEPGNKEGKGNIFKCEVGKDFDCEKSKDDGITCRTKGSKREFECPEKVNFYCKDNIKFEVKPQG